MRFGLELQVALVAVLAIVAFKGALDVDRVRVVSFDEIAVIAVRRTHERCKPGPSLTISSNLCVGGCRATVRLFLSRSSNCPFEKSSTAELTKTNRYMDRFICYLEAM